MADYCGARHCCNPRSQYCDKHSDIDTLRIRVSKLEEALRTAMFIVADIQRDAAAAYGAAVTTSVGYGPLKALAERLSSALAPTPSDEEMP